MRNPPRHVLALAAVLAWFGAAIPAKGAPYQAATGAAADYDFNAMLQPVFTVEGSEFAAEDPFIWRGSDRYWAVVKDNQGNFTHRGCSLALFESADGIAWNLAQHPLVTVPEIRWANGSTQKLSALERPQVWLENGVPKVLFCAGADDSVRGQSFNVQIPLQP